MPPISNRLLNSKNLLIAICFFTCYIPSFGQTNEWTWVNGDTLATTNVVYGARGGFATANVPGARENAVSWTDKAGNLWLFSGNGYCGGGGNGDLNDLWEYSITRGEWSWVAGDTTGNSNGIYGMKGTASAGNKPGGRFYAVSCTDTAGNLWMFGGQGYAATGNTYDYLGDLWMYNTSTRKWTWESGDKTLDGFSIFGTKGIEAATNKPGSRLGAICWADHLNNLWLFGGYGYVSSGAPGIMNDLWKFNTTTLKWTWVSGDTVNSSSTSMKGIYGTKGTADSTNKPGGRFYSISEIDNSGNLWLFGGLGYDAIGGADDVLSDLWEYSPVTNKWTWVSGDSTVDHRGLYGTKGVPSPLNKPGGRYQSVSWADSSGNFWLFGGEGYAASGPYAQLNDLWEYNFTLGQWVWISGDSTINNTGIYGTLGTAAPANKPGSRYTQVSWLDHSNNLWLLGGNGYAAVSGGLLSDLWKFSPGLFTPVPVVQYTSSVNTVCAGDTISFTDQSSYSPTSWNWTFTGGTPDTSTARNPTVIYNVHGTYDVKLRVSNSGGTDSLTKAAYIVVNRLPVPVVTTADSLLCSGDSTQVCTGDTFASYLWSTNDGSYCTTARASGGYWVTVTDANHCSAVSSHQQITVYPATTVSITSNLDTLVSYGAHSYQWLLNGDSISGATGATYIAKTTGNYSVQITDTNGCNVISTSTNVIVNGIAQVNESRELNIYPNPFTNTVFISTNNIESVEISDVTGRVISVQNFIAQNKTVEMPLPDLKQGLYYVKIITSNTTYFEPIIKQ